MREFRQSSEGNRSIISLRTNKIHERSEQAKHHEQASAQLKAANSKKVKPNDSANPKTLDQARSRIAELEAQLASGTPALKPAKASINRVTSVHKAPTMASQHVGTVASMEAIQGELDAAKSPADRVNLLQSHIEARQATLKNANHMTVDSQETFKQIQRLQKTQAYAMHSDPVLWANRNKVYPNDLA